MVWKNTLRRFDFPDLTGLPLHDCMHGFPVRSELQYLIKVRTRTLNIVLFRGNIILTFMRP
jgi:hypothetical protein